MILVQLRMGERQMTSAPLSLFLHGKLGPVKIRGPRRCGNQFSGVYKRSQICLELPYIWVFDHFLDLNWYSQVEAALQILFLLLGGSLLILGVPIPSSNPDFTPPSSPTHQIFRSPLKIQPADTDNQELTTPPSVTGTLFHSDKTKQGAVISTNGGTKTTVVETKLLPCFPPLSSRKNLGEEGFRWRQEIYCPLFFSHPYHKQCWCYGAESIGMGMFEKRRQSLRKVTYCRRRECQAFCSADVGTVSPSPPNVHHIQVISHSSAHTPKEIQYLSNNAFLSISFISIKGAFSIDGFRCPCAPSNYK